jgi:uncharacterized membrane protein YvbJ
VKPDNYCRYCGKKFTDKIVEQMEANINKLAKKNFMSVSVVAVFICLFVAYLIAAVR